VKTIGPLIKERSIRPAIALYISKNTASIAAFSYIVACLPQNALEEFS
jgi:hypothetical protein